MSPELLNISLCESLGYNVEQTDLFAVGVILFSMLMGRPPFWKADPITDRQYKQIHEQRYREFWALWEDQYAHARGIRISQDLKMLFNSLVSSIPCFRLTINEVLCHPWIS